MNMTKVKILLSIITSMVLFSIAQFSSAQTVAAPEFLVTWSAKTYVPSDYLGKILPTKSSQVSIGLDLVDRNKIADLSGATISWFLNENFIRSGVGLKNININLNGGLSSNIRVSITDYSADELDHIFSIQSVEPEIVIDTKNPLILSRNQIQLPAKDHLLEARPFFFNITNPNELNFKWRVDNKLISGSAENPGFLNLNLGTTGGTAKETRMTVSASATNIRDQFEFGSKSYNFSVK